MPATALPQLLDRDLAKANVREWIDVAVPLLQEVVNYGTNVYAPPSRNPCRWRNRPCGLLQKGSRGKWPVPTRT